MNSNHVQTVINNCVPTQLGVQRACCEFLKEQLDPSNCLGIKAFAEAHGCEELRQAAQNYILKYFTDLVESEEFLLLSDDEALGLVQCDNLAVSIKPPLPSPFQPHPNYQTPLRPPLDLYVCKGTLSIIQLLAMENWYLQL